MQTDWILQLSTCVCLTPHSALLGMVWGIRQDGDSLTRNVQAHPFSYYGPSSPTYVPDLISGGTCPLILSLVLQELVLKGRIWLWPVVGDQTPHLGTGHQCALFWFRQGDSTRGPLTIASRGLIESWCLILRTKILRCRQLNILF